MSKLLLFLFYTTAIFFFPNQSWIIVLALVDSIAMFAAWIIYHVDVRKIIIYILKFLPFIVMVFFFNYWLVDYESALWISYKLFIVCCITVIYASTTSVLEVAVTIQELCTPLKLFHVDTTDIKILVCISLSLIPTLERQLRDIRLACAAKRMPINMHTIKPILVCFFTSVFSRVEQIEASLLAKGYQEP